MYILLHTAQFSPSNKQQYTFILCTLHITLFAKCFLYIMKAVHVHTSVRYPIRQQYITNSHRDLLLAQPSAGPTVLRQDNPNIPSNVNCLTWVEKKR